MTSRGKVITFYSYKGGVGRSFALANVGVVLAQWGFKVLLVDWDIEAPGLNYYFPEQASRSKGVVDFLGQHHGDIDWRDFAAQIANEGWESNLYLMPAIGPQHERSLATKVQQLDWKRLFRNHRLGERLENLRAQWIESFDFVLLDSRTGITDFSGVTTALLPDAICFMFTANEQSLMGCKSVVRRAMSARKNLPIDRPALLPIPIPSKFERNDEYAQARYWQDRFASELSDLCKSWIPKNVDLRKIIDLITVPYVARWNFGEELSCAVEKPDASGVRYPSMSVSYALETMAAIVANNFADVEQLAESRDEYVRLAQSRHRHKMQDPNRPLRVFLSISGGSTRFAHQVSSEIHSSGFQTTAYVGGSPDTVVDDTIREDLEEADVLLAIFGQVPSQWQEREIELFVRDLVRPDGARKFFLPIVLPEGRETFFRSRAASFLALFLEPDDDTIKRVITELRRLDASRAAVGAYR